MKSVGRQRTNAPVATVPDSDRTAVRYDNLQSMSEGKLKARTKRELIIEVWEALDCESVGAQELRAIEEAVRKRFGNGAVESHARVARLLADEGAELRHPEVLELDVQQRLSDPYFELFRNVLSLSDLDTAAASIMKCEELRKMFASRQDQTGLRRLRDIALKGKGSAQSIAKDSSVDNVRRAEQSEIAEWLAIWLQQPEVYETWLEIRRGTTEFRERFGRR